MAEEMTEQFGDISIHLASPDLIRYWSYGESVKSIAKSLGISEDACRKRLYRAKEHLKDALEQEAKDLEEKS